MADLDDLLLQAAGRTGGASGRKNNSRPPSKWDRDALLSDTSDDKEDDSDNNQRPKSRKSSGSQIPLKKRIDPPSEKDKKRGWRDDYDDDEGDDDEDNDSDSAPSIGSDLYKDEVDKAELANMPELHREMILAERATKLDDYKLRQKARASSSSKPGKGRKEASLPLPNRSRSSARLDRTDTKSDALKELRAKRMRQRDPEGYHRLKGSSSGGGGGVKDSSPAKHRPTPIHTPSDDSGGSEHGNKSEDESPEDLKGDSLDDETLKFDDIKGITIRRSKLAKWFMEPFFEDLIVGCFVRVGIGKSRSGIPTYRLCTVKNVDSSDPDRQYKLESWMTCKWINCVWGSDKSAARWQMAMVSDSPPLEEEFKEWVREVERSGGRMLSRQDVLEKRDAIIKINSYVYNAATVKQMLQEKKSASSRPLNIAAEKDRLRKEMEVAEARGDVTEIERIRARLKELVSMSHRSKEKDIKAVRLAEMNKKNRAENFKNASEMKPVNTSLKAGEAGYDPFSRRWTRSTNYYVSKTGGERNEANGGGGGGSAEFAATVSGPVTVNEAVGPTNGVAVTAAALEAAAGAGKLVDTMAPIDLGTESNSLHNFDLPISLADLQRFGGASGAVKGFLARKQKIEATIGYRVPESDGRRDACTLTISDYKRRMGLI